MITSSMQINYFLVFIEGVISFFSPCILPLIPLYMGYLVGHARKEQSDGTIIYQKHVVFLYTLFFVLGISFAFFLLGLSFSFLRVFLRSYRNLFCMIGSIIIIILGIVELGVIHIPFMNREYKMHISNKNKMNIFMAFVMGFTFSFAWTPCVGPMLSSVLILASNASHALVGNMLVLLYALGFVLPFFLLGLFTTQVLNFIKEKKKLLQYTIKIGGIVLILIGSMLFISTVTDMVKKRSLLPYLQSNTSIHPDFDLKDQYGKRHRLKEKKGHVIFLNFLDIHCIPCMKELPMVESVYASYQESNKDVEILGIVRVQNGNEDEIKKFLKEHAYTFPVLFDITGSITDQYMISSYPTTFMLDKEGKIYGYIYGELSKERMVEMIEQTLLQ